MAQIRDPAYLANPPSYKEATNTVTIAPTPIRSFSASSRTSLPEYTAREPHIRPYTASEKPEPRFTLSATPTVPSRAPRKAVALNKPLIIPQTTTKPTSPFPLICPSFLTSYNIPQSDFYAILTTLNTLLSPTLTSKSFKLAGSVLLHLPFPLFPLHPAGVLVKAGARAGHNAASRRRVDAYLEQINVECFAANKLRISVLRGDAVRRVVGMKREEPLIEPLLLSLGQSGSSKSTFERRIAAVADYATPLENLQAHIPAPQAPSQDSGCRAESEMRLAQVMELEDRISKLRIRGAISSRKELAELAQLECKLRDIYAVEAGRDAREAEKSLWLVIENVT